MAKDVLNKSKLTETEEKILKRCVCETHDEDIILYPISGIREFISFKVALISYILISVSIIISVLIGIPTDDLLLRGVIGWVGIYFSILLFKLYNEDMWNKSICKII